MVSSALIEPDFTTRSVGVTVAFIEMLELELITFPGEIFNASGPVASSEPPLPGSILGCVVATKSLMAWLHAIRGWASKIRKIMFLRFFIPKTYRQVVTLN